MTATATDSHRLLHAQAATKRHRQPQYYRLLRQPPETRSIQRQSKTAKATATHRQPLTPIGTGSRSHRQALTSAQRHRQPQSAIERHIDNQPQTATDTHRHPLPEAATASHRQPQTARPIAADSHNREVCQIQIGSKQDLDKILKGSTPPQVFTPSQPTPTTPTTTSDPTHPAQPDTSAHVLHV